jgi:hypothetical protein
VNGSTRTRHSGRHPSLALAGLLLVTPGCALSPTLDAAANISDELTQQAKDWLCNRQSMRSYREHFPMEQDRYGLAMICHKTLPLTTKDQPDGISRKPDTDT